METMHENVALLELLRESNKLLKKVGTTPEAMWQRYSDGDIDSDQLDTLLEGHLPDWMLSRPRSAQGCIVAGEGSSRFNDCLDLYRWLDQQERDLTPRDIECIFDEALENFESYDECENQWRFDSIDNYDDEEILSLMGVDRPAIESISRCSFITIDTNVFWEEWKSNRSHIEITDNHILTLD